LSEPREFHGQINAEGQLRFDNAMAWRGYMVRLAGRRVVVAVEAEHARRTPQHNARYWTVLVPLAREFLSRTRDIPLSKDQTHWILASAFAGTEMSALGVPIPKRTRDMTTEEFHVFCTEVEVWLAENEIPVPDKDQPLEATL
jgi:hypothetical protein